MKSFCLILLVLCLSVNCQNVIPDYEVYMQFEFILFYLLLFFFHYLLLIFFPYPFLNSKSTKSLHSFIFKSREMLVCLCVYLLVKIKTRGKPKSCRCKNQWNKTTKFFCSECCCLKGPLKGQRIRGGICSGACNGAQMLCYEYWRKGDKKWEKCENGVKKDRSQPLNPLWIEKYQKIEKIAWICGAMCAKGHLKGRVIHNSSF